MTKRFHISDVLSITTGLLVSTRHCTGVYDILNWMTQNNLYTHQLPRASDECKPHLLRQFPWLEKVDADSLKPLIEGFEEQRGTEQAIIAWWTNLSRDYNMYFDVEPLYQAREESRLAEKALRKRRT